MQCPRAKATLSNARLLLTSLHFFLEPIPQFLAKCIIVCFRPAGGDPRRGDQILEKRSPSMSAQLR